MFESVRSVRLKEGLGNKERENRERGGDWRERESRIAERERKKERKKESSY